MKIKMTGIDYRQATLAEREVFAFTTAQAETAMQNVVQSPGIQGAVLVSTCNRTELWISAGDDRDIDLGQLLCELKQAPLAQYKNLWIVREGKEAVDHLLATASGLNSQIWGEDQILGQIKSSLEKAREAGTTDQVLEKLFQTAITCGKKIKTQIRLTSVDVSVATKAVEIIEEQFPSLKEPECLVIGNGEMGRMVAGLLVKRGAKVTVTLRQYKRGISPIPDGCASIPYDDRLEKIKDTDIIVSATSSPHYTVKLGEVKEILTDQKQRLFLDLAVPRDVDPALKKFPNVRLLDTDSLGYSSPEDSHSASLASARQIIAEYREEFLKWSKARELLPVIQEIAFSVSEKVKGDLSKEIAGLSLSTEQKRRFELKLGSVTTKAVQNALFLLKDNLDDDMWVECFGNLDMSRRKK